MVNTGIFDRNIIINGFYGLSLEVLIELMTQGAYKPQHLVYQLNLDNGAIEWEIQIVHIRRLI